MADEHQWQQWEAFRGSDGPEREKLEKDQHRSTATTWVYMADKGRLYVYLPNGRQWVNVSPGAPRPVPQRAGERTK